VQRQAANYNPFVATANLLPQLALFFEFVRIKPIATRQPWAQAILFFLATFDVAFNGIAAIITFYINQGTRPYGTQVGLPMGSNDHADNA
jgi:hypothetical protein